MEESLAAAEEEILRCVEEEKLLQTSGLVEHTCFNQTTQHYLRSSEESTQPGFIQLI